jgi:toxin LF subunit
MSVSEHDSGMTTEHIDAVEKLMKAENTFLFVRPTEYDSTVLIKEGFATKSMDIHDKSSNWGPMAGMVPCDPAFSKKLIGAPDPKGAYHPHGKAVPVHLSLPQSLYLKFLGTKVEAVQNQYVLDGDRVTKGVKKVPGVQFCRAKDYQEIGPKSTVFCLKGQDPMDVWWVEWDNLAKQAGTLRPVIVWAYLVEGKPKPVTGDYDLWMVAPFWRALSGHTMIQIHKDEHGASAATDYITKLLQRMNDVCGRTHNPVFQHGAESQNYGFTQNLDKRLAMFTPAGESYPISHKVLPQILVEIQDAGYLAYWNKRYGDIDPKLSGKEWYKREESASKALLAFAKYQAEMQGLRDQGINTGSGAEAVAERQRKGQTGVGAARFRHAVRQVIARGDQDIRAFHNELMDLMRQDVKPLTVLQASDFGVGTDGQDRYQQFQGDLRKMMQQFQSGVVNATDESGTGQANLDQLSAMLDEWKKTWEGYHGSE